jgi:hypothetical protein
VSTIPDGDPRDTNRHGVEVSAVRPILEVGAGRRQERRERREKFARQERRDMRGERVVLLRKALLWALAAALPGALVGWGLAYLLDNFAGELGPGWAPPGGGVSMLLGALCGALGAALAGLCYHSLLAEDQDVPLILGGVTTSAAILGGIYGAGQGGVLHTAAGITLGIPAGLCGGVAVWMVYSVLSWAYRWARAEV